MKNQLLSDIKAEDEIVHISNLAYSNEGKALMALIGRRLEKAKTFLRDPGEHPDEWKRDVRWLMAERNLLEDIADLPQAAKNKMEN